MSIIKYIIKTGKPRGKMYHGPGHARSRKGLSLYHETNSLRGIRKAAELGYDWIDLDVMLTKDKVLICNHAFGAMEKEGFRAKGVPMKPIDQLTWNQVRRLRAPDGIGIQKLDRMLAECAKLGIGAALDLKGDGREGFRLIKPYRMNRIAILANNRKAKVYIKASFTKRMLRVGIKMARNRGFWVRYNNTIKFYPPY